MKSLHLRCGMKEYALRVERQGTRLTIQDEEGCKRLLEFRQRGQELILVEEGRTSRLHMVRSGEKVWVIHKGDIWCGERHHPDAVGVAEDNSSAVDLVAPMNGRVVSVLVEQGAEVAEGDGVVVIEAMKMEHKLVAPFAARVESLSCEVGQQVDMNELLAHLVRLETN